MRFFILTSGILLFTVTLFMPSFVSTATKHGCAPVVPPVVSGTPVQPTATRGAVFINEALLTPHSVWNCSELIKYDTVHDTWLEIYNPQNQPLDLYSVHTSIDCGPNTNSFYLPFGSAIAPHSFLVVFPRLDSNFLATETSTWRLLIGGIPVDEVSLPLLGEDQSYARVPDGSATWVITSSPTIDGNNTLSLLPPIATKTKAEVTATARASGISKGNGSTRSGGSGSGSSENGSSIGTGNGQQVDGVQPTWNSLKHPDSSTSNPSTVTQANNPILQTSNNGLDIFHKIILTLLVFAFAGAFFWCWRLFRRP